MLAAGGSTRMGRPKGLLDVDGRPLLLRHVDALQAAGLDVTVVLGAHEAAYRAALADLTSQRSGVPNRELRIVVNPDWDRTTMGDSARIGLAARAAVDGGPRGPDAAVAPGPSGPVLLLPVDLPPPRAGTLAALLAAPGDAVPTFQGVPGHPVRLDGPLRPGERLDERLAGAARVPVDDPDCVLNLNTPEAWAAWIRSRAPAGPATWP